MCPRCWRSWTEDGRQLRAGQQRWAAGCGDGTDPHPQLRLCSCELRRVAPLPPCLALRGVLRGWCVPCGPSAGWSCGAAAGDGAGGNRMKAVGRSVELQLRGTLLQHCSIACRWRLKAGRPRAQCGPMCLRVPAGHGRLHCSSSCPIYLYAVYSYLFWQEGAGAAGPRLQQ